MGLPREREFLLFGLGPENRSWRGVWLLLGVFFGAIAFAAITSPLVFWAIIEWANASPNELNTYLADKDFPRYFDRLRLLFVIIAFPWLLKVCGLFSWKALGMRGGSGWWRSLLLWLVIGVVLLGLAAAVQALTVGIVLKEAWSSFAFLQTALMAAVAAAIIALLEESVFRGLVLRLFYTAVIPLPAVLLAAFFFAIVHFKKIPEAIWGEDAVVSWSSGFYVGLWTLLSMGATFEWIKFLNLFLSGLVLCLLFIKNRSLWHCIGLHAGWVIFRQVYSELFIVGESDFSRLWGSAGIIDGLLPTLLLSTLAGWLYYRTAKE